MNLTATATRTIAILRDAQDLEPLFNNHHVSAQVYFSWDDEEAEITATATTEVGRLLDATLEISGKPRWLTLNIGLGQGTFEVGDQIVILAEMAGDASTPVTFSILSAQGGAPEDTVLDTPVDLMPKGRVHSIIHSVSDEDVMAGDEAYHTLVLRLPKTSHHLRINDLSFRILPRARGLRAASRRLADFA